jgi:hypothetical protein
MDGDAPATPEDARARLSVEITAGGAASSPGVSPVSVSSSSAENGRVVAEEDDAAEERLRVRLKMLDEHVFEVDATPSTTVTAFRELVARATQVPPPRQRLIYRGTSPCSCWFTTRSCEWIAYKMLFCSLTGKLMKDGAALSSYDVQDGHTVHLVAKPPTSTAAETAGDTSSANASSHTSMQTSAVWDRSRDRLRHLLNTIDASDNEGSDFADEQEERAASRSSTLRRRTPVRDRDGLAGNALNIAMLRDALDGSSGRRETERPLPRLPQFREFFGDLENASQSIAAEMGLAPPTAAGSSNRGAATIDLEHISQAMLTVRTVLSTVAADTTQELDRGEEVAGSEDAAAEEAGPQTPPSSPGRAARGRRRFFVGQWIDVKDTVNQWLECTIMDIANGKVLVHYHGWPSRWDEWLDFDSERIAAFRTRTLHTMNPRQMSPVPSTRVQDAPRAGTNDVREMVTQLRELMHEVMPHMDRFADLCEAETQQERAAREEEDLEAHYSSLEESGHLTSDHRVASSDSAWDRANEISEMAHLVAPLFDRVGRMLVDSARCLDPLLRPELQASSQRQQHRLSVMRGRRSSSGLQRQATAARVRLMEQRDTSLSIRDLIATSPRNPEDSLPPRRSIDVHIHAIVAPASLSSFASLTRSSGESTRQAIASTPREPDHQEFDEAFGIPSLRPSQGGASDGRAILNDDNDDSSDGESQDPSRIPLLGSFRGDESADENRQRRTVEENLDEFLADDFFGPSFDHPSANRRASDNSQGPSSSLSQYSSIPSPISDRSSVMGRSHVIPEIAEAEEREEMRARDRDAGTVTSRPGDGYMSERVPRDSERARESSASSSSSSSTGFPTFLEVMRRTLSGVRNLGFASNNSRSRPDRRPANDHTGNLSVSSSSSSLPSLSPRDVDERRRSYESHASEVEEDELDQLD